MTVKTKTSSSDPFSSAGAVEPVVYVVDDDISVRESLGNLMRSVGLKVELFASATEFRNHRRSHGKACLVLDVRLPGMSGLDLQGELNRLGDPVPIVFITGHGDVPMSVRAMKGGALEFLQKPFREQDLLDAIHAALAQPPPSPQTARTVSSAPRPGSPTPAASASSGAAAEAFPAVASELDPRQTLARNLQLGRAIFNWSQEDLGSHCELHRSHISALERAELSVGVDAIDSIAAAFRVSPHVILMPPGEAQSILLESFNGVAKKPRRGARSTQS